jgi:5-formyltetrahydrofolate cyclo-ligase
MDKDSLRRYFIKQRAQLGKSAQDNYSQRIADSVATLLPWGTLRNVHIYTSQPKLNEVSTKALIAALKSSYPSLHITVGETRKEALLPTDSFDVIIVPLVAFDMHRNRLGHGGGWYDRMLSEQPNAVTIGLGYDEQEAANVPVESHDIPLDYVVTQSRVITK